MIKYNILNNYLLTLTLHKQSNDYVLYLMYIGHTTYINYYVIEKYDFGFTILTQFLEAPLSK